MRAQGYPSSDSGVRRDVSAWREPTPQPGSAGLPLSAKEEVFSLSTRKTRWHLNGEGGPVGEADGYVS
jgi:hypothetical protein